MIPTDRAGPDKFARTGKTVKLGPIRPPDTKPKSKNRPSQTTYLDHVTGPDENPPVRGDAQKSGQQYAPVEPRMPSRHRDEKVSPLATLRFLPGQNSQDVQKSRRPT